MSKATQVQFPNLLEFLGWHGTFILGTVVIFKFLLDSVGASGCPCTGHVVYGIAMLGLPAVSIYLVAFFSYFFLGDSQSPWKYLKAYFKLKQPCSYSQRSRSWEMHSGVFHQCTECQGKWRKIKIAVSILISFVYPILWLALGFRQQTYYACAHVGPDPGGILSLCDNWNESDKYDKKYNLAIFKSLLVGNVLLVVVIVLASAIFITYHLIRRKLADMADLEVEDDNYDRERLSHTPVNNFGHESEGIVNPDAQGPRFSGAMPRSTEGTSPGSGRSYEGFRERSGEVNRSRSSPRDSQPPLIKVEG